MRPDTTPPRVLQPAKPARRKDHRADRRNAARAAAKANGIKAAQVWEVMQRDVVYGSEPAPSRRSPWEDRRLLKRHRDGLEG